MVSTDSTEPDTLVPDGPSCSLNLLSEKMEQAPKEYERWGKYRDVRVKFGLHWKYIMKDGWLTGTRKRRRIMGL